MILKKIKLRLNSIEEKYLLINLDISGVISAFEARKSPDERKLGLKINSLIITK